MSKYELIIAIRNKWQQIHPHLRWLHSIPNGGNPHPSVPSQMVREGATKGIPDLFLPVPRVPIPCDGYHGLYIEMKTEKGTLTKEQKEFFAFAGNNGYLCKVCRSSDEALDVLGGYLSLKLKSP